MLFFRKKKEKKKRKDYTQWKKKRYKASLFFFRTYGTSITEYFIVEKLQTEELNCSETKS